MCSGGGLIRRSQWVCAGGCGDKDPFKVANEKPRSMNCCNSFLVKHFPPWIRRPQSLDYVGFVKGVFAATTGEIGWRIMVHKFANI
jgi:hypothetical protein